MESKFTKYEVARILGARALQVAMDAPLLIKIEKDKLDVVGHDPLKIAEIEFSAEVLPITVKRPLPKRIESALRKEKAVREKDEKILEKERREEKDIKEEGEIMELAKPEDEIEESEGKNSEE